MSLSPGARLGPYEVIAPVGAGGMGEVFRARDTRLDRQVAIKVLPAEFANNAQLKLRFEREVKAISQLSHPNICTLYDVGDGFIVMELLEGETLSDRLANGPLPIIDVLKIGAQVAYALDRAHKAGIIHRDLKPSNVMLTKSGAKLLDFGLAKEAAGLGPRSSVVEPIQRQLTEEGTVLGTYQYMAPEQLAGEPADARTDIFAFGALLYEMITGRRAFDGKTKTSIITSIVSREPSPISDVQPFTPPALEHVVRKCLSKDPEDRWQSAHDIGSELRWISNSGSAAGLAAPVLRSRRSKERLLWIGALVVVAAAAIAIATKLHLGEVQRQYRFTVPIIDAGYRNGAASRISPDGESIYFRATVNGTHRSQIYRRRLDTLVATPIDGTEDALNALPSPDNRTLLLSYSAGVAKRISINGGPVETVVHGLGGLSSVSRDGTILLGGDDRPVSRVVGGGKPEEITTINKSLGEVGHASPYFLPDGKSFLFLSVRRDVQRGTVQRILCGSRIGSKEVTPIGEVTTRVEYARGNLYFVRGGTLMAQPFDVSNFKFTGEAVPVADNVAFNGRIGFAAFSVAENGTILYQTFAPPQQLSIVDAAGRSVTKVVSANVSSGRFALFPDGSRVAVCVNDRRAGIVSLWVYGLTSETATRLTFSPANEVAPVVAPDGSHVFFAADDDGPWDIYEAPVDGSEPPHSVVAAPNVQMPNAVSPDGRFLLYQSNETGVLTKQDLFVLPLVDGARPHPFLRTPAIENEGTFSPDGKWVAYSSDVTGTSNIYVRPFPGPGAARQVSAKGGHWARFSADGKRLYFADETNLMVADFHGDGSTSEPVVAFDFRDQILQFAPMAGDRFMILSQSDADASPAPRVIVGWHP